jgi:hypothetical protein
MIRLPRWSWAQVSASDAGRGVASPAREEGQQSRVQTEQRRHAQRACRAQQLFQLPLLRGISFTLFPSLAMV